MKRAALLTLTLLAACAEMPKTELVTDQKERQRIFKECLQLLPAGPHSTQYNDWDEVVAQCDSVARAQAQVEVPYGSALVK